MIPELHRYPHPPNESFIPSAFLLGRKKKSRGPSRDPGIRSGGRMPSWGHVRDKASNYCIDWGNFTRG